MPPMQTTRINDRYEIKLDPGRINQHNIWLASGGWEVERLEAMHETIKPGDFVIDIGAELGDFTALFALWGAEVGIVEPSAGMWPSIRQTWIANVDRDPVFSFIGFASDTDSGFVDNALSPAWPDESIGGLTKEPGFCHLDEQRDLPQITIDNIVDITGLTPNVVTIDIEGSELACLHGASETLKTGITTFFVSVHPDFMRDRWGYSRDDLLDYMYSFGYDGAHLATDHEEHWKFTKGN